MTVFKLRSRPQLLISHIQTIVIRSTQLPLQLTGLGCVQTHGRSYSLHACRSYHTQTRRSSSPAVGFPTSSREQTAPWPPLSARWWVLSWACWEQRASSPPPAWTSGRRRTSSITPWRPCSRTRACGGRVSARAPASPSAGRISPFWGCQVGWQREGRGREKGIS